MHGKGVYTYHNGDMYDGEWREDKRHGKGTVTYAPADDGSTEKYVGDWVEGKMHGLGRYEYADGGIYEVAMLHLVATPGPLHGLVTCKRSGENGRILSVPEHTKHG